MFVLFISGTLLDSVKCAKLSANAAACAKCLVDHSLAVLEGKRRTAKTHTTAARTALVTLNVHCGRNLYGLEKYAGTARNDYGRLVSCKLFCECGLAFLEVVGIDNANAIDTESTAKCLKVDL